MQKGLRIAKWIGIAVGISFLAVPVFLVYVTENPFTELQASLFLSGASLGFAAACVFHLIARYKEGKKVGIFCVCMLIVFLLLGVGVWF